MLVFGPVPSRRLGRSLGINNIPPKICTYSCIYCQLGRKSRICSDRSSFYEPEDIFKEVSIKLEEAAKKGIKVNYLTYVPDGEPLLDITIGESIRMLKSLDSKVAVITNASLIGDEKVREDLSCADWVSIKVDTVNNSIWKKLNRPHKMIVLDRILEGAELFKDSFNGKLVTETMLVKGVNDNADQVNMSGDFIKTLDPDTAYLSIPTRPPHVSTVEKPDQETIIRSYQIFRNRLDRVELLTGYEGNTFISTGDPVKDILDITAVHPMRKEALEKMLEEKSQTWRVIEILLGEKKLSQVNYRGHQYYLRNFL